MRSIYAGVHAAEAIRDIPRGCCCFWQWSKWRGGYYYRPAYGMVADCPWHGPVTP